MSYVTTKCDNCGIDVIFDDDPYQNLTATKYWSSTYEQPKDAKFVMQRKIPSTNNKGKMTVRVLPEFILKTYCSANCGLEDS